MDFRLTACFYTHTVQILWQAAGHMVALQLLILFLYVVVLRPFCGKVVAKGHTPLEMYRIQTSYPPENKPFHIQQGWKVLDFTPESQFYRTAQHILILKQ